MSKASLGELINRSEVLIGDILHDILKLVARRGKDKIVKVNKKFELGGVEEELGRSKKQLSEIKAYIDNPAKYNINDRGIKIITRAYKLLEKEIRNIEKVRKQILKEQADAKKAKDTPPKKELTPAEEQELLEQKHALNNLQSDLVSEKSTANTKGNKGGQANLQIANNHIKDRLLQILGSGRDDLNYNKIGAAWSLLRRHTNNGKIKLDVEQLEKLFSKKDQQNEANRMKEVEEILQDDIDTARDGNTTSLDDAENIVDEDYTPHESDEGNYNPKTSEEYIHEAKLVRDSTLRNISKVKILRQNDPDVVARMDELAEELNKAETPEDIQIIDENIQDYLDCLNGR